MCSARNPRDIVITAQKSATMAAARKTVVDQPRQNSFAGGIVAVSDVLADTSLPGPERLYSFFDESAVAALMAHAAG